jgi:carbon-monoxide dehydrogenase iron sulfur subunit
MKRIYVNEKWCLGCHLCEYYCAYASTGQKDMAKALKNKKIYPRINVDGIGDINFAVSCRHCTQPLCVKSCITGALTKQNGVVTIDREKCVGCLTCVAVCPYGALVYDGGKSVNKCQLCVENGGKPACAQNCPNMAIVYEERG